MDFIEELRLFRERTTDPGYDGLILLGTRQATTAALLLGTFQLQRVAFLLTEETSTMPQDVAALLGCSPDGWYCPPGDHSTTLRVYEGLRTLLDQWDDLDRTKIAVDVTGGLKPMSLGLEKAAHVLGLQTIYIQSNYRKLPDGRSVVVPGSQRLEIPPDPYTVFGDLEAAEAQRLFAAHDYAGAQRIFTELGRRVPAPSNELYRACAALAQAYAAWDAFDLPQAEAFLEEVLAGTLPDRLETERPQLHAQLASLQHLNRAGRAISGRGGPSLAVLRDVPTMLALLGSLHANALRREAQGRYDVAALLRYRCLELLSQQRLATYGVLSERPQFAEAERNIPDLEARYREVQRNQERRRTYPLPDRAFGLFVGYMLLAALDDPLVEGYDIGQIERRTKARNYSILAHGYRLITAEEYGQFSTVVDELLDRFLALPDVAQDRVQWEQIHRFVQPF